MTPLRSALSNWHLGGQNAIHRTFAAQVDVFVEQGRHNLGRGAVHESLQTQRVEDLVSFLLAQGTGWGRAGLPMSGRWPPTTTEPPDGGTGVGTSGALKHPRSGNGFVRASLLRTFPVG